MSKILKVEYFIDINPKIHLDKDHIYNFVEMDMIKPGKRYVKSNNKKKYTGGGSKFKNGDILFARITPCLENGKIAQYKAINDEDIAFGSTEFIVLRNKKGISDLSYIYYLSLSDLIRRPAEKSMTGASGRQRADLITIKNIEISLPDLLIQEKIGKLLSSYDNLIEINNRRIELLEEMARLIYTEWLIHFRFPGHENVKMIDSPLGKIPEGWEYSNLENVIEFVIGGGWGNDTNDNEYSEPGYVIRGTDIPYVKYGSTINCPLRYHKKSNIKSRKLRTNDIVIEVSGGSKDQPVGRSLLMSKVLLQSFKNDVICASFCKLIRIKNNILTPILVYNHLNELYRTGQIMKYQTQSTGITNFKFQYFIENDLILIPNKNVQNEYNKNMAPLLDEIHLLGIINEKLRNIRNYILPKLISGEIDVSNLDIASPETINTVT